MASILKEPFGDSGIATEDVIKKVHMRCYRKTEDASEVGRLPVFPGPVMNLDGPDTGKVHANSQSESPHKRGNKGARAAHPPVPFLGKRAHNESSVDDLARLTAANWMAAAEISHVE